MTSPARRFLRLSLLLVPLAFAAGAWADPPHTGVCGTCHSNHAATYPAQVGQLCEGCHFPGGPALAVETHSSLSTGTGYGNWHVQCWGCHDPHKQHQDRTYGTTYGMYLPVEFAADIEEIDPNDPGPYYAPLAILRTVTSSNLEHTSPNGFVDGDAEFSDDICQVCHQSTAYYDTGANFNYHANYAPDSQPGGDCIQCHSHDGGFKLDGGCSICHALPQGSPTPYRRQVVGAGGDFERVSHHVSDGSPTEIVTDDDCGVCHSQDNHRMELEPEVVLNDPDAGASVTHVYDGTGASLETFCLNCHDAAGPLAYDSDHDGSDGHQPFGDGRTPQDIATGWADAAHHAATPAALGDEACMACHGGSDATRSGLGADPNAHGSDGASILSGSINGVNVANVEEELCFACHDGGIAGGDIAAEFGKTYGHPLGLGSGVHDPSEPAVVDVGHVECADCHEPHQADPRVDLPGPSLLPRSTAGPLDGARGVDLAGAAVDPAVFEYEVCLRCHGDSPGMPPAPTNRQFPQTNVRFEIDGSMTSFHAVAVTGTINDHVPSLTGGWTKNSVIACTACHNNDSGPNTGGTGPNGPHGSVRPALLERRYETADNTTYTSAKYAMCFKCHDANTIFDNNQSFEEHGKHIDGEDTPCNVCHDPHGSGSQKFLINFDTGVVSPWNGRLEYIAPEDSGDGRGYCYLRCHGKNHDPFDYQPNY